MGDGDPEQWMGGWVWGSGVHGCTSELILSPLSVFDRSSVPDGGVKYKSAPPPSIG